MNQLLNDVVRWINGNNKEVIIKISGHGAAGKSTFLETDPYIIDSEIRKKAVLTYIYIFENKERQSTILK